MSIEALKQALNALETIERFLDPLAKWQIRKPKDGGPMITVYPQKVAEEAINDLRAAIEQAACSTGLCHFNLTQTKLGIKDIGMQAYEEAWGDKVVAPTHRVFQEWLNNPLTKALKQSHKNEIEKLAQWMIKKGYATGHGDTIEDLLQELAWQIDEDLDKARGER